MRRSSRFAGRRIDAGAATALTLAVGAFALRLPRAFGDELWQDEVASARILREPTLGRVLGHVARTESTPPLWYVLGWATHHAGVPIVDVRLLSALCGAALVGLTVVLARRLVPLGPAAVAGVLVAVGGQFAFAGRELRSYVLLALLAVAFALLLDAAVRASTRPALVGLAAVVWAGALTHYFFLLTVAGGLAWLWLEPAARHTRRAATLAVASGLVLAAPWVPWALRQYRQDRYAWIGPFNGRVVANTALRMFTPLVQGEALAVAALLVAAFGVLRLARLSPTGRLVAALAVVPWLLAAVLWLAGVRIYAQRNLIEIGAFLALAAAAALAASPVRARAALLAAVAGAAVCSYTWLQLTPATPYAGIAATLVHEGWRPSDPVLVFGSPYALRSPLEWYLPSAPRLAVVRARGTTCHLMYVVAGREAARLLTDDLLHAHRVGTFLVARARLDDALRGRDASLLAARAARLRCARPAVSA